MCRTMIATYGVLALLGVLALPLSVLFGFLVFATVFETGSSVARGGIERLNLEAFLALAVVGLFFWDLFMLMQFWRFTFRRSTLFRPLTLWSFSVASFTAWIVWFLLVSHSAGWLATPGFSLYAFCVLMWPLAGLVLSFCALYTRIRNA